MSDVEAEPSDTATSLGEDAAAAFLLITERFRGMTPPWSVAELTLSRSEIGRIRECLADLPRGTLKKLKTREGAHRNTTAADVVGCLFLVVAADASCEVATESSLWPAVSAAIPEESACHKIFFTRGQPSLTGKALLEAAARRFGCRHVFDAEVADKYFDTIRLQHGFTYRGACEKLPEWLVGLGVPLAVRILCGEEARYPGLASESFGNLWSSLRAYRLRHISKTAAEAVVQASPWIRAHWRTTILERACDRRVVSVPGERRTKGLGPVEKIGLSWPSGETARVEVWLKRDAITRAGSETQSGQLRAAVDGKVIARWTRQGDDTWHGTDHFFCEPDSMLPQVNLRPTQLTLSSGEGEVLEEIDVGSPWLRRDVVVFELDGLGMLTDDEPELDTKKNYGILADADLTLDGEADIEWKRVGSRKVFRLAAPWNPNARLVLDGLEFWQPVVREKVRTERLSVKLTAPNTETIELGQKVILAADGVPEDAESVALLLGEEVVELVMRAGSWTTPRSIDISPELVLGLERRRATVRFGTSVQTVPAGLGFVPRGVAVCEPERDGGARWRQLTSDQQLDTASGRTQLRVLGLARRGRALLFEGRRSVGPVSSRGVRLARLNLHGWGADLRTVEDETERRIASSVMDRGCLYYVLHGLFGRAVAMPAHLRFRTPVEHSKDHELWLWRENGTNGTDLVSVARENIQVRDGGLVWEVAGVPETYGLAVTYRGKRLGSWWDHLRELSRHSMDPEVLALIRWFRIPVLAEDASSVRYKMQGAVHKAPLEFLAAWLANKGLPNGLSGSGCDEGVRGVVRHFLWGWADRPGVVEKMAPLFAESCGAAPGDIGRAIREMADTCPPLLWAWRYRLPITRAQEVLKYLHEERLKLESPADWRAVMRRARVPERAAAMISTSLEARDLGRVVESDDVRQLGESRKGRAALSALILETVVKLRTEAKD